MSLNVKVGLSSVTSCSYAPMYWYEPLIVIEDCSSVFVRDLSINTMHELHNQHSIPYNFAMKNVLHIYYVWEWTLQV